MEISPSQSEDKKYASLWPEGIMHTGYYHAVC